jgi:hypothetical protein
VHLNRWTREHHRRRRAGWKASAPAGLAIPRSTLGAWVGTRTNANVRHVLPCADSRPVSTSNRTFRFTPAEDESLVNDQSPFGVAVHAGLRYWLHGLYTSTDAKAVFRTAPVARSGTYSVIGLYRISNCQKVSHRHDMIRPLRKTNRAEDDKFVYCA